MDNLGVAQCVLQNVGLCFIGEDLGVADSGSNCDEETRQYSGVHWLLLLL